MYGPVLKTTQLSARAQNHVSPERCRKSFTIIFLGEGEGIVPGEYFFGFYKTRHILLSNSANCTVLRAVVLTQYRRVTDRQTDRQTDGIAVASTALAMRALRRALETYGVNVEQLYPKC